MDAIAREQLDRPAAFWRAGLAGGDGRCQAPEFFRWRSSRRAWLVPLQILAPTPAPPGAPTPSRPSANHWFAFTELHWRPAWFDDREVGDGTALEHAGLLGHEIEVETDPTRRVSFRTWTRTQLLSNGFTQRGDAGLLVRVLPQLDVELLPTWVYTRGEPRFTGQGATAGQYLFGRLEAKSIGAVLRATYTFTPRLTLQTFDQLFLALGHYSSPSSVQTDPAAPRPLVHLSDLRPLAAAPTTNPDFQEGSLNVRVVLRWEYSLGSTLYLVYTRSQAPALTLGSGEDPHLSFTSVRRAPAADVILAKLTYWWPSR